MSKYNITHSCGHVKTINIGGPMADRGRRAEYEAGKLCRECWLKKRADDRAAASLSAANEAAEHKLPALIGSVKQIAWAEQVRKAHFDILDPLVGKGITPEIQTAFRAEVDEYMAETSAHAWIECRNNTPTAKWLCDAIQKHALLDADLARTVRTALVAGKLAQANA